MLLLRMPAIFPVALIHHCFPYIYKRKNKKDFDRTFRFDEQVIQKSAMHIVKKIALGIQ